MAFYKLHAGVLLSGTESVSGPDYILTADMEDKTNLPDGWMWVENDEVVRDNLEVSDDSVPTEIQSWQGKRVLADMGLYDSIVEWVNTQGMSSKIMWSDAHIWHIDSDFITAAAATLGLTSEQLNTMFTSAAAIK